MILLIGSEAYSSFRLDAIRDALSRIDPLLGPVDIDARWVYALQAKGDGVPAEDLERASSLLNACGECDSADSL